MLFKVYEGVISDDLNMELIKTYTGNELSMYGSGRVVKSVDNSVVVKFKSNRRSRGFLLRYEVERFILFST